MSVLDPNDTIAAIGSPPGPALRGIVRLSGPEAWSIALSGFQGDHAQGLPNHPSRWPGVYQADGLRNRLPADLFLWPAPRTYTGQELAEIHTLGSPPLLAKVLAHTLQRGARLAEPGEFTLRAFLSGRIDLTRAEAVLGVIDAQNPRQLDSALKQLAGGLFQPIASLRDHLLDVLSHLEANLDFMDEPDVDPIDRLELADTLFQNANELTSLADRLQSRERTERPPRVVLVGPPNAGKSRLFNALLESRQAIVSPIAGTTRDYLTAVCLCEGLSIELVDTAGEESPTFSIETQAQAHRAEQAELADLLLICLPCDDQTSAWPGYPGRQSLRLRTKADLPFEPDRIPISETETDFIRVSAERGEGLPTLRKAIASTLLQQANESDLPASTAARCRDSLLRASQSLARASEAIALELGDELISIDLRQTVDDLGQVVGAVVTDDILDRIFSKFCIGK